MNPSRIAWASNQSLPIFSDSRAGPQPPSSMSPHCPRAAAPSASNCKKNARRPATRRQLLERSAYIDSPTNLGNRGGLDRHVDLLWLKGTPFTCAYIDIDHLKHCNDKFGHAEGNRYILSICRALTETIKHDEMLFRIGGDEFVLVSPTSEAELEQRLGGYAPTLSRRHQTIKRS